MPGLSHLLILKLRRWEIMPPRRPLAVLLAAFLIATGTPSRADLAPPAEAPAATGAAAIKLVLWYDRARPFETFRFRAYDLGKGEYTKAVDDWMALMERSYPGYTVAVRDLPAMEGDPAGRIAAAVEDEKLALARLILEKYSMGSPRRNLTYGSGYSGFSWSPQSSVLNRNVSPFANAIPRSLYPLGAAHTVPSQPYLFPTPMPYPRPHP
jgi:hypothetical protein